MNQRSNYRKQTNASAMPTGTSSSHSQDKSKETSESQRSLFADLPPENPQGKWKTRPDFPKQEPARARRTDPETSHDAAKHVDPDSSRAKVILALYRGGKGSSAHVARYLNKTVISVSPCFAPLRRQGFIHDTGERVYELSNSPWIVWGLTDEGRELAIHLVGLE